MNTQETEPRLVRWGRPVQGRLWQEHRSKCGRFVIANRGDDYLVTASLAGKEKVRGFDTLREAKDQAELWAFKAKPPSTEGGKP
jgi:hypothetical protein